MNKNEQKRYALVRVECPDKKEIDAQLVCFPKDNNCSGCRYGDTKDQLTNKMAQVLLKDYLKSFKGVKIDKASMKKFWQMQKKLAIEIFDFMWKEENK